MNSIGVDVGGTKIAAALVNSDGTSERTVEVPSTPDDTDHMLESIVEAIEQLEVAESLPVGVAVAGYLDRPRSMVRFSPNIDAWRNVPLRANLEARLGRAVRLENDANAAAYGEWRHGAGRGYEDVLMVTLGTGVGGGVVIGGSVLIGGTGTGGEVGHITVEPGGRLCGCGLRGCLEAYSSGTALAKSGRKALEDKVAGHEALAERCSGDAAALESPEIVELAQNGDLLSQELVGDVGRWLGRGIATMSAILDPQRIVVGGGLAEVGDLVLGPAREMYAQIQERGHRPTVTVALAELGNDAGVIGAAALAAAEAGR
ncbi:ROK family protein [Demetria terragena]|uniref:ROK family protein n=1 Tax=Demetria terragena TaxID=63959 RepID=UPI000376830D|nr:ROK family protein [Demetria terragena]